MTYSNASKTKRLVNKKASARNWGKKKKRFKLESEIGKGEMNNIVLILDTVTTETHEQFLILLRKKDTLKQTNQLSLHGGMTLEGLHLTLCLTAPDTSLPKCALESLSQSSY